MSLSCNALEVLKKKTDRTGDAWNIIAGGLNSLKIMTFKYILDETIY